MVDGDAREALKLAKQTIRARPYDNPTKLGAWQFTALKSLPEGVLHETAGATLT